jgi:glutamine synthetase
MTEADRQGLGIQSLPGSLNEAIEEMEKSDLVRRALGDHIFEKFIENKRIEWNEYRTQVHAYELKKYLGVL